MMTKFNQEDNIWKIKFEGAVPCNETDDLCDLQREIISELYQKGYCDVNGDIVMLPKGD